MSKSIIDLTKVIEESEDEEISCYEDPESDSNYNTREESNAQNDSHVMWKKLYKDVFCPTKEENNKMIFRYSQKFLDERKRALILDSKHIRTTLKLLMLGQELERITIVESDPKIYEVQNEKLKYIDNIEIFNDLVQNFIPLHTTLDYNIYYIDAMCSYPNIKDTLDVIMSRSNQKKIILALTSPLRNSGDSYEDVIVYIKEKNRKIFSKYQYDSNIIHEVRYNGQNMCNKGMYFILYYVEKREFFKKYNFLIDLS
jgi:hypothetical protein